MHGFLTFFLDVTLKRKHLRIRIIIELSKLNDHFLTDYKKEKRV
jgi:hypothetical protein